MDPISLHSAEHSVRHIHESYIKLLQAFLRMASSSVSFRSARQYALTSLFRGDNFTGYSNSFCICFATEQCSRNSKMQCQRYRYREKSLIYRSIRTRTPFLEFSPAQVTDLCKCIAPVSTKKTVTKQKRAEHTVLRTLEKRQTVASCRAEMSIQFTEPYHFCKFYNS
jgi:hypothetical protein